ncbi:hypothetical protein KAW48_02340 [candidate division WOR-3 bacterium]|nr:hypothetical protein [candidate division WOR-3 bacterium]
MNKRHLAFIIGLLLSVSVFFYGIFLKQFIATGINGSFLCLYCIGIG